MPRYPILMMAVEEHSSEAGDADLGARSIGLIHLGAALSEGQQERQLASAGAGAFWRISHDARGRQQLDQLVAGLGAGATVHVTGLDAFGRSLPELLRLVRGLLETGVTIKVVEAENTSVISPLEPVAEAMRTLVAFASSHRQAADTGHARRPRTATLSEVQVKYARRLFSDGEPLRTIGLIMRVAPDDVWKAISKQPRGAGRP